MFSDMKINSIRNKFDSVNEALVNYVCIFIAAEKKIDEFFSTSHIAINYFLRLDVANEIGGLLVYVRSYLPSRQLTNQRISLDMLDFAIEINLRKEKFS